MSRVYVGMSGGVDSSVSAAILQAEGHEVVGVYMKNWTQDLPGMKCPWAEDLADAKRVAVQLGIDFKVFDFQEEYRQKVVDYMIREYQAGRTPNPDIMCNQEIKFKLFLEAALEDGAEMIATGHYARVKRDEGQLAPSAVAAGDPEGGHPERFSAQLENFLGGNPKGQDPPTAEVRAGAQRHLPQASLLMGIDHNKDQTYFLYRVTEDALAHTLFPVGELTKPEVRAKAEQFGLVTAAKKDSQGICFVGEIGIKEFLQQYVSGEPGEIIDQKTGQYVGQHDGAIFYTIGQRHGLGVGGGLPYYVVGKDMAKNIVYVTTDLNDETLWRSDVQLNHLHWINEPPKEGTTYHVRTRYRARLVACTVVFEGDEQVRIKLEDPERAITPGQSAVFYDGERVLGGGVVISR